MKSQKLPSKNGVGVTRRLMSAIGLPYSGHGIKPLRVAQAASILLQKRASESNSGVQAIKEKSKIVALAAHSLLAFDTNHFGVPMGRIDPFFYWPEATEQAIGGLLANSIKQLLKYDCHQIVLRLPTNESRICHAASQLGFYLVDTSIHYYFDFRHQSVAATEAPKGITIRMADESDGNALLAMTRRCFSNYYGRFHSDPWFDSKKANDLYVEWMRNSLSGRLADGVLLAEYQNKPAGFLTLSRDLWADSSLGVRFGEGTLTATDPRYRGRGIHRALMSAGLEWFATNIDILRMVTHIQNIPTQRTWVKLGFLPGDSRYSFHWRQPQEKSKNLSR